jgi:LPXTG-motif cell wall-anchored protein
MKEEKEKEEGLTRILTLAGFAAFIALPFVFFSKKRKKEHGGSAISSNDESNIFAEELEE